MKREFSGLRKLIHDDNMYVFYVHCQLQLIVVALSRC
jgi:hypothetical protein